MDVHRFVHRPGFTQFHAPAWIQTLLNAFPHMRDGSRVVALPDGRQVYLAALFTGRLGPWSWWEALPFAFLGGPVVDEGQITPADLEQIIRTIQPGLGWLSINLDPLDPLAIPSALGSSASRLTTHVLRLEGDFEAAQRRFTKTARYDARAAEKRGVQARRGQARPDFDTYLALTRLAAARWGLSSTPFPAALYGALAALPPESVRLWLARVDERDIAGLVMVVYAPGRALYWASAMHPDHAALNPTKLLLREAIREVCAEGVEVINMGPSAGFDGRPLEGVRQLKESFGAEAHDYAVILRFNPWALRLRSVRDRLLRAGRR